MFAPFAVNAETSFTDTTSPACAEVAARDETAAAKVVASVQYRAENATDGSTLIGRGKSRTERPVVVVGWSPAENWMSPAPNANRK